jgi:glycosyltransferase involved in cell wall biosynthesis
VPQKDIFQKPPVLGTIGRITNVKGIHNLVGMLRISIKLSNSQFTFILAGRIDDNAYAKKVLSELRNLLSDKFCYLGEVATPEEFYKKLDIVIVPSIARETGAIVTLEAMAAGKVVVANNLYPMNTYIKDSVNGLLYDDIESAGIKISNLLLEPKIRIELANNALKFVKSHDALLICNKLEARYITHI